MTKGAAVTDETIGDPVDGICKPTLQDLTVTRMQRSPGLAESFEVASWLTRGRCATVTRMRGNPLRLLIVPDLLPMAMQGIDHGLLAEAVVAFVHLEDEMRASRERLDPAAAARAAAVELLDVGNARFSARLVCGDRAGQVICGPTGEPLCWADKTALANWLLATGHTVVDPEGMAPTVADVADVGVDDLVDGSVDRGLSPRC